MKILKKILKLIIYFVSIISLIILGGNIKHCSNNQNKEKKETTNIRLSDRSNTLPNNPYSINQLSMEIDIFHDNLIYSDYDYLLYNLTNGETRLTNSLTSDGIANAYEPSNQYSPDYGIHSYYKYQAEIIESNGSHIDSIWFGFYIKQVYSNDELNVPLNIKTCLIGLDAENNILNEPYFGQYRNITPNDYINSAWEQISNETFNQIYNLYLVLDIEKVENVNTWSTLEISSTPISNISLYDYDYDDFVSVYYPNVYADFLLQDYKTFIGQLEANNQGLSEENISLNNQIQNLEQENERLEQEYNEAYDLGLAEGQAQAFNIINFLERILLMLDSVLSVEILPYIRLWYIVAIPLVLGVVKMVLSWFR